MALGRRLGKVLRGGDIVLLTGELGSGKTTLVKGIAAGAGFKGRVSSPTFTLAQTYRAPRLAVHHLDLYRVAQTESGDIGIEDYLADERGVCLIEWPNAAEAFRPQSGLEVSIEVVAQDDSSLHRRRLRLKPRGARGLAVLKSLAAKRVAP